MTAKPDDPDLREVIEREMWLLDPRVRASAEAVTALLHEDFREFGASGRAWDRASVVAELAADPGGDVGVSNVEASRLAPDIVLVTYVVTRPGRRSLRSSVWRRDASGWRLLFHQGTTQR